MTFCLVCGKPLLDTTLHCSLKGCNFGAHTTCIDILVDLNQLNFEPDSFCCNSLLQNGKALELTSNQVLKYKFSKKSISHKQYKRILEPKRRKIIVHKTKKTRSTRYLYDPKICEFCDYPMSLYERDHLMCHCSAFKTNPCSKKRRLNLSDETFIARHFELAKLKYNKLAAENIRVP